VTTAPHAPLSRAEVAGTVRWVTSHQEPSGALPWWRGGPLDPWDHVHTAMGLAAVGELDRSRAAFRYLARTQQPSGGWPAEVHGVHVRDPAQQSNHAAYLATGLWHLYHHGGGVQFLAEMWPTLDRAMGFVLGLQLPNGTIAWAQRGGQVWRAPLVAGSASIHGSLVCALRIAARLGHARPRWRAARARLAQALRQGLRPFQDTDLPEGPGRHSMDWYYPVLGGAVRGGPGRRLLLDPAWSQAFIEPGAGCRCVSDAPWYTVAETAELVLAFHTVGLDQQARDLLAWTRWQRTDDGSYWTGTTHPAMETYPAGEQTTWTAATILLAHAAVHQGAPTSDAFHELDGRDLDASEPPVISLSPEATGAAPAAE
jgi:hypothetical protein